MKCQETIQRSFNGFNHYSKCENEAKYKASYIGGVSGEFVNVCLCGVHLKSLEQKQIRLKKKTKFDIKLTKTNI